MVLPSTTAVERDTPLSTHQHRLEVVNRTARYIDENLGEPLTLDDMARAARCSKFHLHRVFEAYAGSTLGGYLGGVRMKAALLLLSEPETSALSVLDVALQVGFEDASAFSRSFRRRYGQTPSAVRRGASPRRFPGFSGASPEVPLEPSVELVSLPAFWVYGHEVGGQRNKTFTEAPQGFSVVWDTLVRHGVEGIRTLAGPSHDWRLRDDACRLLCGFRSIPRLALGSLRERAVPAGTWLRARHRGPYDTRWQTWQRLTLQRCRLGRSPDDRPPFEEELEDESRRLGQPCCDVYIPC